MYIYSKPFPAWETRALLFASSVIRSRPAVCSRAGAELAISSFATSGQEGAADGDISDPLIVIGAELEMVPTTDGPFAFPPISRQAATIPRTARRGNMS